VLKYPQKLYFYNIIFILHTKKETVTPPDLLMVSSHTFWSLGDSGIPFWDFSPTRKN